MLLGAKILTFEKQQKYKTHSKSKRAFKELPVNIYFYKDHIPFRREEGSHFLAATRRINWFCIECRRNIRLARGSVQSAYDFALNNHNQYKQCFY